MKLDYYLKEIIKIKEKYSNDIYGCEFRSDYKEVFDNVDKYFKENFGISVKDFKCKNSCNNCIDPCYKCNILMCNQCGFYGTLIARILKNKKVEELKDSKCPYVKCAIILKGNGII